MSQPLNTSATTCTLSTSRTTSAPSARLLQDTSRRLPQVECFDAAFTVVIRELADRYAMPKSRHQEGVRRTLSRFVLEYIASRLPDRRRHRRAQRGRCPSQQRRIQRAPASWQERGEHHGLYRADGLPMGTRPGQLDAGIVLYLLTEKGMSAKEIERLFYQDSGLKGLSGTSNDVRDLLASSDRPANSRSTISFTAFRCSPACCRGHVRHRRIGVHRRRRRECACHSRSA